MTQPNPISKYKPSIEDEGDRQPFTDKNEIAGVPLVITGAKNLPGKKGRFWLIQATRQDTGEVITLSGSKVIDEAMAAVAAANAFPVAAMLEKVEADNPQGFYWNIVDPPAGVESAPSNGGPSYGSAPSDRVQFIKSLIDAHEAITAEEVKRIVADLAGEGKEVNDLDDGQWAELQSQLDVLSGSPF